MASLVYVLTMPGRNTWNGKWSGDEQLFALIRRVPKTKKAQEKAAKIIAEGPYSYGWSDGWRASVSVSMVEGSKLAGIRKRSSGFCGYDWMVDSIERHGEIMTRDEAKAKAETPPWKEEP